MRRRSSFSFLLLILFSVTLCAQPFWQKKPYSKWSKSECSKMLEDSPWAVSYAFNAMAMETLQAGQPDGRGRESSPQVRYTVQLRSALPLRQTEVRLEQLSLNYDSLPGEKKQVFDQDAAKFLVRVQDFVQFQVNFTSNVQDYARDLARHWQARNPSEMQNLIFLNTPGGGRISPLRFAPLKGAGDGFILAFPRQAEGKPLLETQDQSLTLEFPHPRIGRIQEGRVVVEFKASKMTVDGQILY